MSATLTLSAVEQAAVLNHIRIQHSRLIPSSGDAVVLEALWGRIASTRVLGLERVEAIIMLRHLRRQAHSLSRDMISLEERRIRGGFNGQLENAHRALDAEKTCIEDVIRRLWAVIM